jgi:glutamyl-tRNA synthetase
MCKNSESAHRKFADAAKYKWKAFVVDFSRVFGIWLALFFAHPHTALSALLLSFSADIPRMALEEIIRKHCLKNAHDYKLAIPAKVIGKVIAEWPDAKADMKGTMAKINEIAKEVNALTYEQAEAELVKYEGHFEEMARLKVEADANRKIELPGAQMGKVVTRFAPEPSGYPHIGHAKAAFLSYQTSQQYEGKMLLRFDDTNPEKELQEYVDALRDGLLWLGISWVAETYTSDRMVELYTFAEELMVKHSAYVCTCAPDVIKKNRMEMRECDCRANDDQGNLLLWKKMLGEKIAAGGAILRFRGGMHAQNTVMRDPALFRILEAEHYRQGKKYRVWPSYDFEAPIMDAEEGVTYAMRSKEYELRDELYFAILEKLELRKPVLIDFSRLSIKNAPLSKRLITPLVKEGKVHGWDDPRLPTLAGLRRRGILPDAIRIFVLSFGLSKVESEPGWDKLLDENRKLLEPTSQRRFFVSTPVKLTVSGAPAKKAILRNHPNNDAMGTRGIETNGVFFISGNDAAALTLGETFRLKELYNVKITEKGESNIVGEFAGEELIEGKKLHWVAEPNVPCSVLVAHDLFESEKFVEGSLETRQGLCETSCLALTEGDIIQFERYGFVRLDRKTADGLEFVHSC